MVNPLRGMKDTVGEFSEKYTYVVENCTKIAKNYGFSFIETPILEETQLFKRSVGESSDIVGKEMYQFIDKGQNDVCMRPEGTAGVVRAFITQKYDRAGGIKRFFYHGPMFRYERPQKGRLRQFHQFGAETFGQESVKEDAMIILMLKEMFDVLGITYRLQINSLGDFNCMPQYRDNLVKFLDKTEGLCEDCQRRKLTNPIRVLDCKNEHCQSLLKDAPMLLDNLCSTCKDDFEELKSILDGFNVTYEVDTKLVRGLDYYNKTAFEFISDGIGAQNAIAGGGRYDKLVEFLDGRPTAGVGFAMGIERLADLVVMPETKKEGYYIGALSEDALKQVFQLVVKKRKTDAVHTLYSAKSIKAHLKAADKANAKFFICIGDDELKNQTLVLKDLETKEEKILKWDEL
ncbi:histidine--tRNA ligase [Sulfurospirillum arcachonense]|uniref:histidine--tRNA ligase n=1 Tax=Sulfurospirillum arcachonense TaxID=57666 RepID=UPI0004685F26|nr:histidine--tRNA ligase [Sulfurospirillum arcachonense]